ncbi:hypothetical protein [Anaerorhabdus sp.]|uniref:hypothetical protein n=1 Tax=Anaerorhabdus sp. TaxID=1872524 RepID=UPI002FC8C310
MNRKSVLFLNDCKFINSARVIDVKAHLDVDSAYFAQIKKRIIQMIDEDEGE